MDDPEKTAEFIIELDDEQLIQGPEVTIENRWEMFQETNQFGVLEIDTYGNILHVNAQMVGILGYPQHQLGNWEIWPLLASGEDRKSLAQFLGGLARSYTMPLFWRGQYKNATGQFLDLEQIWYPITNAQGQTISFVALCVYSEQESSEIPDGQSRSSQEQKSDLAQTTYEHILAFAPDMVLVFDMDGMIRFANHQCSEIIGYFEEELLGMNMADIVNPHDLDDFRQQILSGGQNYESRSVCSSVEFINRNLNPVLLDVSGAVIPGTGSGEQIIMVARDPGKRLETEMEQLKASKFESVRTFASGIVHDLNDFLTGVLGNVEFAQLELDSPDKVQKRLNDIREVCLGVKELTRLMIGFSKSAMLNRKIGSIAGVIQDCGNLLVGDPNLVCNFVIAEDLWPIEYDEALIRQVMNNLVVNCVEAIPPEGGTICVEAENVSVTRENRQHVVKDGRYVHVRVKDDGKGIAPHDLPKVFDPYFSTKKIGAKRGMGLGLAIVYSAISRHGGYIFIHSKVGIGTEVDMYFPVATDESIRKAQPPEPSSRPDRKKRPILLLDPDMVTQNVVGPILEEMGYEMIAVENGETAVEAYRKAMATESEIAAVILDANVRRGISSVESLKRLRAIDPLVKAIVASDYANDPEMIDFEKYGFIAKVDKPYSFDELKHILDRIFSGTDNSETKIPESRND